MKSHGGRRYSSLLDWSKFSVRFDEADIPRLPEVLEAYDHAALHANLLLVRHLFAFCVDGGGEDGCGGEALPGDGLPLVVFEMSRKKAAGGSDVPTPLDSETYAGTSRLLAAKDDGDATADADVDFNCTLATGACTYAFRGEEWHCSMVNEVHAECLQRVDGGWTVVGSTDNLRGHKQSLYFNDMYQPTKVAEKGRQKKALRARRRDDADT